VIQKGGAAPDGGIDIQLRRVERILVQCKHWRAYKVGGAVCFGNSMGDASRGGRGIFVTSGVYTKEAVSLHKGLISC